ncbi:hypothetical protein B0T24DRAFT_620138 [Lasiosphaeria ovina]|uniref:Uncharacterized protein n=1 Tax=Lasiosphaeria ovina TaxID=92902 RepID=A0AAE0KI46_9PEZI|nr:hypothetical protein B0T24DRAFT_620138 [Lasiosphaeria ovina]
MTSRIETNHERPTKGGRTTKGVLFLRLACFILFSGVWASSSGVWSHGRQACMYITPTARGTLYWAKELVRSWGKNGRTGIRGGCQKAFCCLYISTLAFVLRAGGGSAGRSTWYIESLGFASRITYVAWDAI